MAKQRYYTDVKPRLEELEQLAKVGATDTQMAELLGISLCTFYDYKNRHPEFSEAVARAKKKADDIVESALHRAASGYDYEEVTETSAVNSDRKGQTRRTVSKKHVPPNAQAAISWLKNRRPTEWNAADNVNLSGSIAAAKLSPEEEDV